MPLLISSLSVTEVLSLPTLTLDTIDKAKRFLDTFISIPFDDVLAQEAAFFRRTYRLSLPDAAIAATAFVTNTSLVTRDRDFRKVKEITIVEI